MTRLFHIVGPQGSGKSTLARMIAAGCPGAVHLDCEAVRGIGNAAIRAAHAASPLVLVEAEFTQCRHNDLAAGDLVITLRTSHG